MDIGVDNNQHRLMFKRIFILYIQMAFLLPTTMNKVSLVHMAPIFRLDNITEWCKLTFQRFQGIIKMAEVKKKLKEMKEKEKKEKKKKKTKKKKSLNKTQRNQQKQENHPPEKNILLLVLSELMIKEAGLPSMEGHYDSSETMLEVNLGSENDPMFQTQTDQSNVNKPTDSILGLEEELVSDPVQQKMIIVQMETHSQSEPLDIVPIQVCMPPSQTTAASPMQIEPSPQSLPEQKN
ncbi:hypothetical protein Ahy_A10g047790 isoform A [Arachis hypogaea]|uniref:Uncharacterized protein n=1 Tax=Arachis hypogaea TaxID=3818 RepID=A0A445B3G5_ARAHY|nr:hypothetical protein Ahy_A10g047790 isoform A [Arachis hypogaea]